MPAGCHWNTPHGGMFFWVELPEGVDATAMLPQAVALGMAYVPGAAANHSHDYGMAESFKRYFDEYRGLNDSVGERTEASASKAFDIIASSVAEDQKFLEELGQPAAIVAIYQLAGSNAIDTMHRARALMEEAKKKFPNDLDYTVSLDTTLAVTEGIDHERVAVPASHRVPAERRRGIISVRAAVGGNKAKGVIRLRQHHDELGRSFPTGV